MIFIFFRFNSRKKFLLLNNSPICGENTIYRKQFNKKAILLLYWYWYKILSSKMAWTDFVLSFNLFNHFPHLLPLFLPCFFTQLSYLFYHPLNPRSARSFPLRTLIVLDDPQYFASKAMIFSQMRCIVEVIMCLAFTFTPYLIVC